MITKSGLWVAGNDKAQLDDAQAVMTAEAAVRLADLMTVVWAALEQLQRQPLDEAGRRQLRRADQAARQLWEALREVSPLLP